VAGKIVRGGVAGVFLRWTSRLRYPYLLLLMWVLFIGDLLLPDVIPFVDEIFIGLITAFLASLKKKPENDTPEKE
jgi:hypothetical protein